MTDRFYAPLRREALRHSCRPARRRAGATPHRRGLGGARSCAGSCAPTPTAGSSTTRAAATARSPKRSPPRRPRRAPTSAPAPKSQPSGATDAGVEIDTADGSTLSADAVLVDAAAPAPRADCERTTCGRRRGTRTRDTRAAPRLPRAPRSQMDAVRRALLPRGRRALEPPLRAQELPRQPGRPARRHRAVRRDPVLGRRRDVERVDPTCSPAQSVTRSRASDLPTPRTDRRRRAQGAARVSRLPRRLRGRVRDRRRVGVHAPARPPLRSPGPVRARQHAPRARHGLGRGRRASAPTALSTNARWATARARFATHVVED